MQSAQTDLGEVGDVFTVEVDIVWPNQAIAQGRLPDAGIPLDRIGAAEPYHREGCDVHRLLDVMAEGVPWRMAAFPGRRKG